MQRFPLLLLLIAMVSIQGGAALAKQLFPLLGPAGVTTYRTLFAALILWILWRPWKASWQREQLRTLLFYGAALGAMNLLFYFSLQTIPLGMAVALEFTGPLLLSLAISRKLTDLVWVFLAGIGIFLILPQSQLEASADFRGVLFALGAGFCWAIYIWFGKKAGESAHGGKSTAIGMLFAALTVMPFGLQQAGAQLLNWSLLPKGLAVALLSSAVPYTLEMNAMKQIPMKTFGILMSLEPVIAALSGWLFLQETLTPLQLTSIACIVTASLGSTYTSRREAMVLPTDH